MGGASLHLPFTTIYAEKVEESFWDVIILDMGMGMGNWLRS